MSKPRKEYLQFVRRAMLLNYLLNRALDFHKARAIQTSRGREVRYMVGDLVYVQEQLENAICYLLPITKDNLQSFTKEKGRGNE